VDYPVLVKRPDGTHHPEVIKRLPGVHLSEDIGPRGWCGAVMNILNEVWAARSN